MLIARTLLFVPANRERMIEHAVSAPADVIVLDLEDSVPSSQKASARQGVADAIRRLKAAGKTVHVRVNAADTGLLQDDLDAAIVPGLDGLALPKADAAAKIRELDVMLRLREVRAEIRAGSVLLFPQIESALALLRCEEVAIASSRIAGLSLGGEDYVRDLGVPRTREGNEIEYARRVLVHCCIAHRLLPLDVVFPDINDAEGLTAEAAYGRSIGMKGKYVIHPNQIEPVNSVYTPNSEEVATARQVLAAYSDAEARGEGSVQFEGKMIDAPVVQRARDLIAYAEAIGVR
jgi:citrate lyase subunit beta/citryl-CoA lyase